MSKGLKELKRLPKVIKDTFKDSFKIIEKELKEYKQLKQLKLLPYPQENGEEYRQDVIKRLMALEIIKNKGVDVSAVIQIAKSGKSYITYNNHLEKYKGVGDLVNQHRKPLIKEEWNLLTEVLL